MKSNPSSLERIYHLKLVIFALISLGAGVALLALAKYIEGREGWGWLSFWPIGEIGGTLAAAGLFGIAWEYADARDKEEREDDRIRRLLKESAPHFRDAVIAGFAESPENMKGVATAETLDLLAVNALALRLGDQRFASEIYAGLLAQAVHTTERWEDVDVNVRLSSPRAPGAKEGKKSADVPQLFSAVVTWEYTVTLSDRIRRFASTDDPIEFREFLNDGPAAAAWYIPAGTADPADRSAFELLSYSLDGVDLPIRRSVRKHGQTYSIDVGAEVLAAKAPVRVRQVYRTVVERTGHRFRVSLTQPTHGMRLVLDYTDSDIASLKVGELVSSVAPAQVKFLPEGAPAKQVEVSVPGWLLPQAEVTFVWTLEDELPPPHQAAGLSPAGSAGR